MNQTLTVQGMTCGHCEKAVTKAIKTLDPAAPVGSPPIVTNGDIEITFPNGFDTDGYVCYEQEMPLPATLVAIVLRVQTND